MINKLFVYGTLCPGRPYEHILRNIGGSWEDASVTGILHQEGWGTINAADFKSKRGQFIDPDVENMQQIRENQDIIIQSFTSVLRNQRIEPLGNFYEVKFSLLSVLRRN